MIIKTYGLSFASELSLPAMFERLNELGPWSWRERMSDSRGEYISAGVLPRPHVGVVKFIPKEDGTGYWASVKLVWDSEDENGSAAAFAQVQETVVGTILPSIGASDITDAESQES